jgi:hypothetical protein
MDGVQGLELKISFVAAPDLQLITKFIPGSLNKNGFVTKYWVISRLSKPGNQVCML